MVGRNVIGCRSGRKRRSLDRHLLNSQSYSSRTRLRARVRIPDRERRPETRLTFQGDSNHEDESFRHDPQDPARKERVRVVVSSLEAFEERCLLTGFLQGTVLDTGNHPLVGATVELYNSSNAVRRQRRRPHRADTISSTAWRRAPTIWLKSLPPDTPAAVPPPSMRRSIPSSRLPLC